MPLQKVSLVIDALELKIGSYGGCRIPTSLAKLCCSSWYVMQVWNLGSAYTVEPYGPKSSL